MWWVLPPAVFAQPAASSAKPAGMVIPLAGGLSIVVGPQDSAPAKPATVTIPATQWRELQDRVERLQAQVDAAQVVRPRSCELDGRAEQRGRQLVVRLRAVFKVTTTRPDAIVHLGCQRAHAVEAHGPDGKPPLLLAGPDGLRIQLPSAGDHTIRLELEGPITPRSPKGAEIGFDIGLPGAAITALTFTPPSGVKQFTLTTRTPVVGPAPAGPTVEPADADRFRPGKGGVPLGPITSLALAWEDPARRTQAVRSAEAETSVTVGPEELVTEARLRLRGPATEWRFTAPATADVTVSPLGGSSGGRAADFPPGRAPNVIRPEPGQSVWQVESRDGAPGDLTITVASRVPHSAAGRGSFPIGPFVVLDVPEQSGVIRVRSSLGWKASAALHGDCRREADSGSGEQVFRYRFGAMPTPPPEAPVVLTPTPAAGTVHARTRHTLRRSRTGWAVRTEVSLAPAGTQVEQVEVEVGSGSPPNVVESQGTVEDIAPARTGPGGSRTYRVRLNGPRRTSFTFNIETEYATRPPNASLGLPRLLGVSELGSEILVLAPPGYDVRGSVRSWTGKKPADEAIPLEVDNTGPGHRLRAAVGAPAGQVDLRWLPVPADGRIHCETDADVRAGRAVFTQRVQGQFVGSIPGRIHFRTARPVSDVRVTPGLVEPAEDGWDVVLSSDAERNPEFVLTYSAPLASDGELTVLPVMAPQARATSHVVRVWPPMDLGARLSDSSEWRSVPCGIVLTRPTLPGLTVRGDGPVGPLRVHFDPRPADRDSGPVVEAAGVEVRLGEATAYRAWIRYRDAIGGATVELPPAALAIEAAVQGKRLPDSAVRRGDQTWVEIPPLSPTGRAAVVEVQYVLPASRRGRLDPPRMADATMAGEVVWTVVPSPGRLALAGGDVPSDSARTGLFTMFGVAPPTGLTVRASELGPVRVVQVPRASWVIGWSVAAAGLGFGFAMAGGFVRRAGLIVCVVAGFVAVVISPQATALALAAGAPGAVAFGVLAVGYRAVQLRYRWRMARASGFARAGSSLVRPSLVRANEPSRSKAAPFPAASSSAT